MNTRLSIEVVSPTWKTLKWGLYLSTNVEDHVMWRHNNLNTMNQCISKSPCFGFYMFLPFAESHVYHLAARASLTYTPSFRRLSATTDGRIVGDETPDMTRKFTHPKGSKQQDVWFSIKLVLNKIVGCQCCLQQDEVIHCSGRIAPCLTNLVCFCRPQVLIDKVKACESGPPNMFF